MLKKVLFSVAVILLVSAVTFAQPPASAAAGSLYQYQNFVVGDIMTPSTAGMSSILTVSHGESAFSLQSLEVGNEQSAPLGFGFSPLWFPGGFCDACPVKGNQWQTADMAQKTDADADCGIVTVSAFLSGWGVQEQFVGFSDAPKWQAQDLGVAADQLLVSSGNADGRAVNDADDVQQEQTAVNGAGSMGQYSIIDAYQIADTEGKSNTTVSAVNSMVATTAQNQVVY
jgi:hypothetical protein